MRCLILILLSLFIAAAPAGAGERKIHVVTLDFPPYVRENLPGKGWAWKICETILIEAGYQPELQILPWARAVTLTRDGLVDALYLANINEERRQWAVFSEPVGEEISVPFKRRDRQIAEGPVSSFDGLRIGALRGSHVSKLMSGQGVDVFSLVDLEQGFRMVRIGRLDLLVTDRYVGLHLLRTGMAPGFQTDIEAMQTPVDRNNLHLAISRKRPGHEQLRAAFNHGLDVLRMSGRYRKILAEYGF